MTEPESGLQRQIVAIVDDRLTNLKILERLARSLGDEIEVRSYAHPFQALEDANQNPPDLVITDYQMPELDGVEFIQRFLTHPGCADVPVMVITAYEDRELRCKALEAGATDFLLSPVDHNEFRVRSRNLLMLRRQQVMLKERASSLEQRIRAEERRYEDALRESHQMLLRVIDTVPVMVGATDRDGRYVFVNDHFARRFGRPSSSIIGLTPVMLREDLQARTTMERDRRIMAGVDNTSSFEEVTADPDGEPCVLLTTKALLRDARGRPALVVTAALDITDRKEAELAIIAAKEEAELASRSKTEFLANMSHELRTPLNAIIGFSQVMADEMMGPLGSARYAGYARDICTSAQHLLGIITDILDVSKLEAGKVVLEETECDIGQIVRDVLHLVTERARSLEIGVDTDIPADLPRQHADPLKLKQVLLNLVTNAIKFSHSGGRVLLRARFDDGVHLSVVDRGIGMDATELETVVPRFGLIGSSWSRRHPGAGLGLPLAMRLVELHGGHITIESQKGIGTTVTVHLPRERSLSASSALSA